MLVCAYKRRFKEITLEEDVLLLFIFQERNYPGEGCFVVAYKNEKLPWGRVFCCCLYFKKEITLGKDVVGDVVEEREVGQLLLHHLLRLHLHHLSESFKGPSNYHCKPKLHASEDQVCQQY